MSNGRLKRLDDRVLHGPLRVWAAILAVIYPPNARRFVEHLWESPFGWLVPGGAPWKLGRRDSSSRTLSGSWLIWGVWGERIYERGRAKSLREQSSAP